MPDDCKIAEKLSLVHKWAHKITDHSDLSELAEAHRFGEYLMDWLNVQQVPNGVKLLALIEVTASGADHLEELDPDPDEEEEQGTVKVN